MAFFSAGMMSSVKRPEIVPSAAWKEYPAFPSRPVLLPVSLSVRTTVYPAKVWNWLPLILYVPAS